MTDDLEALPSSLSEMPEVGRRRSGVVEAAAVVAAVALVVTAWAAIRMAEAEEDQACLAKAEMTAIATSGAQFDIDETRRAFAECGLEVSVDQD